MNKMHTIEKKRNGLLGKENKRNDRKKHKTRTKITRKYTRTTS